MKTKAPGPSRSVAAAELARDAAAFDTMCKLVEHGGQRRLKPPPLRLLSFAITAGQLELRKARKMGHAA